MRFDVENSYGNNELNYATQYISEKIVFIAYPIVRLLRKSDDTKANTRTAYQKLRVKCDNSFSSYIKDIRTIPGFVFNCNNLSSKMLLTCRSAQYC